MRKREQHTATIREVAKLANVALMTVSRVLNNHASVRPVTRAKVEAAIVKLGYRQNEAARMMKGQRSKTVGLIVPDLSDQFFAACAHTIQHIAREHGYMTLIVASERDADLEVEQAQLMSNRMLSGLLVASSAPIGDERLRKLQSEEFVIVAFDRPLEGAETDSVVVENRAGAEQATQHLIDHGHTRIACLGYDEDSYAVHERLLAFKNLMLSKGLSPQTKLGLRTLEDVREWMEETMLLKDRPTAIFALNHRTSTYVLRALAELQIQVPEEMAVIGFDDFDLADIVSPPLTTIAQSPVELGRRAIHLLLERIRSAQTADSFTPAKIVLPVSLVLRSSCGSHEL